MNDLIDTTEMYLRTVFELHEEGIPPLRARIAERLEHSGPTVSQTVSRMERDGLLHVGSDRRIELTRTGQQVAARVMRKHRLAECMLVTLLDVPWDEVHAEACRWEHVISEPVELRMLEVLGHPKVSPFGNPIPALEELDPSVTDSLDDPGDALPLADVARADTAHVRVIRLDETAQAEPGALAGFRRVGLRPGSIVKCRTSGDQVLVGSAGEYTEVDPHVAAHVMVRPTRPDAAESGGGSDR